MAGRGLGGRLSLFARFPSAVAIFLVRAYQRFVSPYLGEHCRFYPSCSQYSVEAFAKHGFFKGILLTVARLVRCGPWSHGGYDPVPEKMSLFPGRRRGLIERIKPGPKR